MKISTKTLEHIKNVTIVVLSLSTILLLYFFWYQTPYDKYKMGDIPEEGNSVPLTELILPEKVTVSFGDQSYCVMPVELDKFWYSAEEEEYNFIDEFRKFCSSENIYVEEISKSRYDVAMDFRYINADFAYSLPFAEFCDIYDIKRPSSLNVIESVTSFMYSEGSKEGMFVCDDTTKKYYWMFSDKDVTTFSDVIEVVENRQHDLFYELSTFVGVDNDTLIPVLLESNKVSFPSNQEISNDRSSNINKIAKKYFGENFDFVRKIEEDSGRFVYMYGFGEKVFIVNIDGSMEYKEELVAENYTNKKFTECLKVATNFIAGNGGFRTPSSSGNKNYLKKVQALPDKSGYNFIFGEIINGSNLYYDGDNEVISIEVVGGQVTSCKSNNINYDKNYIKEATENSELKTVLAIDMITENHEYIYKAMVETSTFPNEAVDVNDIPTFEDIAVHISKVSTCYFKDENNLVKPAWIVTAGKADIFFDLYTSQPISFKKAV